MLRNAIESYLDSVSREREMDGPILALLAGMGFEDIHFTHGISEFGKDFIAKLNVGGIRFQYAFQSKEGDLGTPEWRAVRGQLVEAAVNRLAHPGFDVTIERRVVLITNGRLVGNAPIDAQETNRHLRDTLRAPEVEIWDREKLAALLTQYGPERVHAERGRADVVQYGRFFKLYGDAISGRLSERQIEDYSQCWLDQKLTGPDRVVLSVIEATLLASACSEQALTYAAVHAILAAFRSIAFAIFIGGTSGNTYLISLAYAILVELLAKVTNATNAIPTPDPKADKCSGILAQATGAGTFVTYPVNCARAMELLALQYVLSEAEQREEIAQRLAALVEFEPGAPHLVSDWYAVSLVIATRVLATAGRDASAAALCRATAVWLGNRYQNEGSGLAQMDVDELEEVRLLLGYSFEKIEVDRRDSSLIATALVDCACFLGEEQLYQDVLHDLEVCRVIPTYYQPQDSIGQFLVEGEDVVVFPNIDLVSPMTPFAELRHGEHLSGEPKLFTLESIVGSAAPIILSLLLRDRYFPTTWARGLDDSPIATLRKGLQG